MKKQRYIVEIEMPDGDFISAGWLKDLIQTDCDVEDEGRKKVIVQETSLPSNLDEAASKYESNLSANYYQDSGYTDNDVIDAFKAGAKWDRAKMMGKAVSGRYMKADGKVYVESWLLDIDPDSVKVGDKVKVIVIREED